jgi:hypothetical protein
MLYSTRSKHAHWPSAPTSSSSKASTLNGDLHIWSSKATQGSTRPLDYGLGTKDEYTNAGSIDTDIEKPRNIELDLLGCSNLWEKPIYEGACIDPSSPQLATQLDSHLQGVGIRTNSWILGLNHEDDHLSYTGLCQGFAAGTYQTKEGNEPGPATNRRVEDRHGFSYPMERYLGTYEKHEPVLEGKC